ncbi:4-diphosphocytidyl-2C-methyl-D-erythritol kinase [Rubidibacter lacunae KORDI 51-2]|uniref:4-diphosphocytidyl-2-C-methyl-D-erythritol kinase n=1 Tax=Rubidibacter lacunae KORDI 51-2 TaxID=582515 RepID=U5DHW9_9CHRO|nr:4-(cytidine 5'-diphospho)-2-C-methyl-D-erythritol kinase [Rubidibacter lacunae]ERN40204.1 4-diphosphocytidyl-2C-methyl-D-erythritol kinase [Rubidibacter lacunae KORDI 51-2]
MHAFSLLAPAKINLYLEIIGDRADGFHELVMVLQAISLCDRVDVRAGSTERIHVSCDTPGMPPETENLAYKAAQLMCEQFPAAHAQFGGVEIAIAKEIPVAAGLAGGSANAAATLVGIDHLWQLGLTVPELQELAAQLGSDVPFCIAGGTALATGRGECLSAIGSPDPLSVVLAKSRVLSVSTAWAYKTHRQQFSSTYVTRPEDIETRATQVHSGPLVRAIAHRDNKQIGNLLRNDLERVVLPEHTLVAQLRSAFLEQRVLGAMMSGSGPTVFALCESPDRAEEVMQAVRARIDNPTVDFWIAQLSGAGVQILD